MRGSSPRARLKVWLYHDETKDAKLEEGKRHAHGILVVPEELVLEWPREERPREERPLIEVERKPLARAPRAEFLAEVQRIRGKVGFDGELHAQGITGRQWGRLEACAAKVLESACAFLRHKGPQGELPGPFFRFGTLFFPPKTPRLRDYYAGGDAERTLQYLETLMRMAIKGVLHYGFTGLEHVFSGVEVEVLGLVLDGDEHLQRPVDEARVVERLRWELRPGLTIAPNFEVRAVDSDPRKYFPGTRDHGDSELIQVADLLLGAVRFVAEGSYKGLCPSGDAWPKLHEKLGSTRRKRAQVYRPFCELLRKSAERRARGSRAWMNSGHYRSFTLSQAEPVGEGWQFHDVGWVVDEEERLLVPLFPDA